MKRLDSSAIYPMTMLPREGSVFVELVRDNTFIVQYLPVEQIREMMEEDDDLRGWSRGVLTEIHCPDGLHGQDLLEPLREHLAHLRSTNDPVALHLSNALSYLEESPRFQARALGADPSPCVIEQRLVLYSL